MPDGGKMLIALECLLQRKWNLNLILNENRKYPNKVRKNRNSKINWNLYKIFDKFIK